MKILCALFLFISPGFNARAQTAPAGLQNGGAPEPPGLTVVKFSWSKERINWERDPFAGTVENFDDMRVRTRNEKRIEDAKRGGNSIEENRVRREANADAANIALRHQQKSPARYVFMYKISVRNGSAKAVKAIDWDYIFFNADTREETGRRQFTSEEKIGAGKSKELIFTISSPPTQTISANVLDDKERKNLGERVVLVRVEFIDGTVWQQP